MFCQTELHFGQKSDPPSPIYTHTNTHTLGFKVHSSTLVKTNNLCTQVLTMHSALTVLRVTKIILALCPPNQPSLPLS